MKHPLDAITDWIKSLPVEHQREIAGVLLDSDEAAPFTAEQISNPVPIFLGWMDSGKALRPAGALGRVGWFKTLFPVYFRDRIDMGAAAEGIAMNAMIAAKFRLEGLDDSASKFSALNASAQERLEGWNAAFHSWQRLLLGPLSEPQLKLWLEEVMAEGIKKK